MVTQGVRIKLFSLSVKMATFFHEILLRENEEKFSVLIKSYLGEHPADMELKEAKAKKKKKSFLI